MLGIPGDSDAIGDGIEEARQAGLRLELEGAVEHGRAAPRAAVHALPRLVVQGRAVRNLFAAYAQAFVLVRCEYSRPLLCLQPPSTPVTAPWARIRTK